MEHMIGGTFQWLYFQHIVISLLNLGRRAPRVVLPCHNSRASFCALILPLDRLIGASWTVIFTIHCSPTSKCLDIARFLQFYLQIKAHCNTKNCVSFIVSLDYTWYFILDAHLWKVVLRNRPILTLVKKEDVSISVSAIPVTTAGPRVVRN